MPITLDEALRTGESHGVEFKKGTGELAAVAETLVAFANAHGGDLFLGVAPDGKTTPGISVGKNTLEELSANLDRHIYPYSPAAIDPLPLDGSDKYVVRLSVVADVPPVIGVYLHSSHAFKADEELPVTHLHAYRRVGRRNRRVPDFMWLRPRTATDPVMVLEHGGSTRGQAMPQSFGGTAWLMEGRGPVTDIRWRLDPPLCAPDSTPQMLPRSDGLRTVRFDFKLGQRADPSDGAWVVFEYRDPWSTVWETRRYWRFHQGEAQPTAQMRYGIVLLPPQRTAA